MQDELFYVSANARLRGVGGVLAAADGFRVAALALDDVCVSSCAAW